MAKKRNRAKTTASANQTVGRVSHKKARGKGKIASKTDWAAVIGRARDEAGSNVALAEALKVSESAIRNWLAGASPPADLLVLIRDILGYDPAFLLSGVGDAVPPQTIDSARSAEQLSGSATRLLKAMAEMSGALKGLLPLLSEADRDRVLDEARRLLEGIRS